MGTYKKIERKVGPTIEKVACDSCTKWKKEKERIEFENKQASNHQKDVMICPGEQEHVCIILGLVLVVQLVTTQVNVLISTHEIRIVIFVILLENPQCMTAEKSL